MASCPVRAEQVLESHGRPLRITLSRPSDCAKYEITLDVALHFGPEDHSCAEKLNKNNDQVGRETLQLFKSGVTHGLYTAEVLEDEFRIENRQNGVSLTLAKEEDGREFSRQLRRSYEQIGVYLEPCFHIGAEIERTPLDDYEAAAHRDGYETVQVYGWALLSQKVVEFHAEKMTLKATLQYGEQEA